MSAIAETNATEAFHTAVAARNWPAARASLAALQLEAPGDPAVALLRSTLLFREGNVAAAEAELQSLHERFPTMPEPLNNLATIAAETGRLEEARTLLERALATHPGYESAFRNLGDVYSQLAARAYARALSDDRSAANAGVNLRLADDLYLPGVCDTDTAAP